MARANGQGTLRYLAALVRPDHGEPGGSRAADDGRAGQAADRVQERGRVRRVLRGVVRRRSETRVRRHHPAASGRQAPRGDQTADRRGGLHNAMEFSHRHDHAQVRAGIGGRLHRGGQTGERHAVFGSGAGGSGGAGGHPSRGVQCGHGVGQGDWRRAHRQSDRAEADIYRFHRNRQGADETVRRHGQEGVVGTGRQCAVHRVR